MAGFGENTGGRTSNVLSNLSKFGSRYEDLLLKNSKAIGFIEGQLAARSDGRDASDLLQFSRAIADTTSQKPVESLERHGMRWRNLEVMLRTGALLLLVRTF